MLGTGQSQLPTADAIKEATTVPLTARPVHQRSLLWNIAQLLNLRGLNHGYSQMDSSALLLRGGMFSTISCKAYGVNRRTTTVPRAESLCYTAVGLTTGRSWELCIRSSTRSPAYDFSRYRLTCAF